MIIKKVDNIDEVITCNYLLTLLIKSESKLDPNCREIEVTDWFQKLYLKEDNIILIAKDNDKIVGYIYVKTNYLDDTHVEKKEAIIDGLYVLEEYRNQGIATNLINEAKKWCIENNLKKVFIHVLANNSAKKLYYKEGFNDYSVNLKIDL